METYHTQLLPEVYDELAAQVFIKFRVHRTLNLVAPTLFIPHALSPL